VFDYSFAQVAAALGRGEAACRQLASRARCGERGTTAAGASARHRRPHGGRETCRAIDAFVAACAPRRLDTLTRMLASDARLVTDGGGKVTAAMNVINGAGRVAAFLAGVVRRGWTADVAVRPAMINGLPGLLLFRPDGLVQTTAFELADGVVTAIYIVRNPDKLRHLA
jgi:RNA polymerase sigma-70 factor (ECF subfamily)